MQCFSALLLAISSNLDNLGVGIAYGIRGVKLLWPSNLLIACLTSVGTFLSMSLGSLISQALPLIMAKYIGAVLMIVAGGWVFWLDRCQSRSGLFRFSRLSLFLKEPFRADIDHSKSINLKEATLLGLALMLNNISSGIGAGMMAMPLLLTTGLVFCFSLCMMTGGVALGKHFASTRLGDKAGVLGALLLVFIGCYELFLS
ncbi:MAG: manganese efflux pump [Sporomusaceae bacterium]|nr:manganese efflux pump [Sporomusaceae bacterium]